MKHMLLIHQGDTPTPRTPEAWGRLSEEEQKGGLQGLPGDRRNSWRHGFRPRAWAARSRDLLGDLDLAEGGTSDDMWGPMGLFATYTLPDWLAIVGFPLAFVGILVGIAQLKSAADNAAGSKEAGEAARDAAEAAQRAIEHTQRNLADNHLVMLLLQLEGLVKELGAAATIAKGIPTADGGALRLMEERGLRILDDWIRVGSQLQTFLNGDQTDEMALIQTLNDSALVAGSAKERLIEQKPLHDATRELREMTTLIDVGCAKVLGRMRAFVREGPSK